MGGLARKKRGSGWVGRGFEVINAVNGGKEKEQRTHVLDDDDIVHREVPGDFFGNTHDALGAISLLELSRLVSSWL